MSRYYLAKMPTFEAGGQTYGGETIRDNDGSLIIMEASDDDNPRRALVVPRFVRLKRGSPSDTPDADQEAFADKMLALLNEA